MKKTIAEKYIESQRSKKRASVHHTWSGPGFYAVCNGVVDSDGYDHKEDAEADVASRSEEDPNFDPATVEVHYFANEEDFRSGNTDQDFLRTAKKEFKVGDAVITCDGERTKIIGFTLLQGEKVAITALPLPNEVVEMYPSLRKCGGEPFSFDDLEKA